MDLSVVVVNWNSGPHLRRLLDSLTSLAGCQILVVDNGSDDESRDLLEGALSPSIRPIIVGKNLGFAGGANLGFQESRQPLVLLLNPDVVVRADSIRRLRDYLHSEPRVAIACGPLLDRDGLPQSAFQLRPLPSSWSLARDVLFLDEILRVVQWHSQAAPPDRACDIEQPAAACWLVRKEAWRRLGGFDEQFHPAWFEDVDFCRRLREKEWRIRFYPDCPVEHYGGHSLDRLGRRRFNRLYHENMLRYVAKHHPGAYPWLWLPVRVGSTIRQWLPW